MRLVHAWWLERKKERGPEHPLTRRNDVYLMIAADIHTVHIFWGHMPISLRQPHKTMTFRSIKERDRFVLTKRGGKMSTGYEEHMRGAAVVDDRLLADPIKLAVAVMTRWQALENLKDPVLSYLRMSMDTWVQAHEALLGTFQAAMEDVDKTERNVDLRFRELASLAHEMNERTEQANTLLDLVRKKHAQALLSLPPPPEQ